MIALLALLMAFIFVGVAVVAYIASHSEDDDDTTQEPQLAASRK